MLRSGAAAGTLYFRMPLLHRAAADELANAVTVVTTYLGVGLMPGFAHAIFGALFAPNLSSGFRYGSKHRQSMDVYTPPPSAVPAPMVLFVHGGAWSWGEAWHFGGLAKRIADAGCVAAAASYRVYPYGGVDAMVDDVVLAAQALLDNAAEFGGDSSRLSLLGHSAGAHLIALTQLRLAAAAVSDSGGAGGNVNGTLLPPDVGPSVPVSPAQARRILTALARGGAMQCAGVYDISRHYAFEAARPLFGSDVGHAWVSPMDPVMGGPPGWGPASPALVAAALPPGAAALLPRQVVLHSAGDEVAPLDGGVTYAHALARAGVADVSFVLEEGQGHATAFIALMGGILPPLTTVQGEALAERLLQQTLALARGEEVPGASTKLSEDTGVPA